MDPSASLPEHSCVLSARNCARSSGGYKCVQDMRRIVYDLTGKTELGHFGTNHHGQDCLGHAPTLEWWGWEAQLHTCTEMGRASPIQ